MRTKIKLLFIVTLMLLGLAIATIINVSLNFREYSIKSALEKAETAARTVEDGLTAHMVNGIMDKREYFLEQISNNDDIKSLWLVRSQHVIKQYGEGFNSELARDAIDEEVLKTGQVIKKIDEYTDKINLRVTMPYKATTVGNINCLTCHDVKRGDTLGAISMEFNITDMRNAGLFTILKILGINLIFIVIALILINYYVTPYMKLFEDLQAGIQEAYSGDFTHKFQTKIKGEAGKVVEQLNTLFEKMHEAFGEIRVNLATFVTDRSSSCNDPLYEAKQIINELSDIYKFKKTIELDENKNIIYSRIIDVLKRKFDIENFAIYEIDNKHNTRKLIYITDEKLTETCNVELVDKNAQKCRACRTHSDVISTEFHNLCTSNHAEDIHFICHPYQINDEASLLINMMSYDELDIPKYTSYMPSITNYLEAAKPVIESNLLMDKLHDTSLRDGMTDLYNRRFLENFIDKVMSQVRRADETYHVLMLDVDFFKMVNDTHGHDVGDRVIVDLANVLRSSIREADLAIRYGGEEFLVMLHNATDEGALMVARKIHQDFGRLRFDVGSGESLQKTISIGIAKFPNDGDTIWKCIKYADTALYNAKNTGRNKIVEFDESMMDKDKYEGSY
ncbi:diguanylate cyclase [Sulfurimonas sp.]|uniref:diguanylate cyclase n=1 Tax=Sulfurimonas sp. TaxID=2022749 RepID=UPI003568C6BE